MDGLGLVELTKKNQKKRTGSDMVKTENVDLRMTLEQREMEIEQLRSELLELKAAHEKKKWDLDYLTDINRVLTHQVHYLQESQAKQEEQLADLKMACEQQKNDLAMKEAVLLAVKKGSYLQQFLLNIQKDFISNNLDS